MISRNLFTLFILLSLCLPAWAQGASVNAAKDLAQRLGQSQELPVNVQLRFQVLAYQMDEMAGKSAADDLLRFFSETRLMVWSQPLSPSTEQAMRSFEQQMVALAQQKGRNLDLPPVGYAPVAENRLITTERVTAQGLAGLLLQTEELATSLLQTNSSADLLFLRDNMTRLREDLNDNRVASNNVRGVLGARVRYLTALGAGNNDPGLLERLNVLGESLRGSFPPQKLRQSAGQEISL